MKKILTLIISLCSLTAFAQNAADMTNQPMTIKQWDDEAKTDSRLLPKYGYQPKTREQKEADIEFINTMLQEDTTARKASNHLMRLGFNYLYTNLKSAMYRFNQAYMLDSTNSDVYWGFGSVYFILGDLTRTRAQYVEGLALNPRNTNILTDYGTYFLAHYFEMQPLSEKDAQVHLDSALTFITKSYNIDPKNPNTTYKLAVCYLYKKDCNNAWKYYKECIAIDGQPVAEEFVKMLNEQCKREK